MSITVIRTFHRYAKCVRKPLAAFAFMCIALSCYAQPANADSDIVSPDSANEGIPGRWYMSTSLPSWMAAVADIGVQYDFAPRWSAGLDLAYSAWNLTGRTFKFRTFKFRPEVRYWLGDDHKGFYAEGHLAMISYNVALPTWEYRIQDRKGHHPALGGGFGGGYRFDLGKSGRWSAEAAVGVGVYALNYDRFVNGRCGALVDTRRRVFFGIDHVAFSIVYNFKSGAR